MAPELEYTIFRITPRTIRLEKEPGIFLGVHVESEVDPLRKVAVWGLPGPEALLAQLLPTDESLFFTEFSVEQARAEYTHLLSQFRNRRIEIVTIQDALVQRLKTPEKYPFNQAPKTRQELVERIKTKGRDIYQKHHLGDLGLLDLADKFLDDDFARLGEREALILNYLLCLRPEIPLANIFYGRDQSNVLGKTIYFSSMRWGIRRPEVRLFRAAYRDYGPCVQTGREGAYFEGGDGIMFNGDYLLGVGGRTSMEGALQIAQSALVINPQAQIYLVMDTRMRAEVMEKSGEEMAAMHLDTYFMPLRQDLVVCCLEEAEKREVYQVKPTAKLGTLALGQLGKFTKFIEHKGWQVIEAPIEEQRRHATNFVVLDEQTVIVTRPRTKTVNLIQAEGFTIVNANLWALGEGGGGAHCSNAPLVRQK